MKKLLILSLLILSACAQKNTNDPRWIKEVDPAFQPYLDRYLVAKGSGLSTDIPIGFADLSDHGSAVGVCTRWSNGFRQIEIDPDYWNSSWTSEQEKTALLFHELGHCDLNRGHETALLVTGWPVSLMCPYVVAYYLGIESYYFNELFHPASISSSLHEEHSHSCVRDIKVKSQPNEVTNE